jgi:hypothetical protein
VSVERRRFPPQWTVDETDACFIVKGKNGQAAALRSDEGFRPQNSIAGAKERKEPRSEIRARRISRGFRA